MNDEDLDLRNLKLELQKNKEPFFVKLKEKLFIIISLFKKEKNNENFDDEPSEPIIKKTNIEEIKEKINNYNQEEEIKIEVDFVLKEKPINNLLKSFFVWINSYCFATFETSPRKFKIRNRILAILLFLIIFLLCFLEDKTYENEVNDRVFNLEKKYENIKEKTNLDLNAEIKEKNKLFLEPQEQKKVIVEEKPKILEKNITISKDTTDEKQRIDVKEIEKIINKVEEKPLAVKENVSELVTEEKSVFSDTEPKQQVNVKDLFSSIKINKETTKKLEVVDLKDVKKTNNINKEISNGIYTIQLAVVKYPERMEKEFLQLKELKFNYNLEKITTKDNETLYRINIGKYTNKEIAIKDSEKINVKLNVKSFVKKQN